MVKKETWLCFRVASNAERVPTKGILIKEGSPTINIRTQGREPRDLLVFQIGIDKIYKAEGYLETLHKPKLQAAQAPEYQRS